MRFSTATEYDRDTRRQAAITTAHMDCGHSLTYRGSPDDIEKNLAANGATIGTTKVSRCKECSARYKARLAEIINGDGMIGKRH